MSLSINLHTSCHLIYNLVQNSLNKNNLKIVDENAFHFNMLQLTNK